MFLAATSKTCHGSSRRDARAWRRRAASRATSLVTPARSASKRRSNTASTKPPLALASGEYTAARLKPLEVTSTGLPRRAQLRASHGVSTRATVAVKQSARRQPSRTSTQTARATARNWPLGRVSTSSPVVTPAHVARRSRSRRMVARSRRSPSGSLSGGPSLATRGGNTAASRPVTTPARHPPSRAATAAASTTTTDPRATLRPTAAPNRGPVSAYSPPRSRGYSGGRKAVGCSKPNGNGWTSPRPSATAAAIPW